MRGVVLAPKYDHVRIELLACQCISVQGIDLKTFQSRIYGWASTITSSGQNMPFALPLRTRQITDGFEVGLAKWRSQEPDKQNSHSPSNAYILE